RRPMSAQRILRRSASPTSARPQWSGIARAGAPSTMPSCGRIGARPMPAPRCGRLGTRPRPRRGPRCCSILLSPPPPFPSSPTTIRGPLAAADGARAAAQAGRLAFGTIDTFLLWRLTGGKLHATDATNAARTLLFDIRRGCWDDELCRLFDIPTALLPEVRD